MQLYSFRPMHGLQSICCYLAGIQQQLYLINHQKLELSNNTKETWNIFPTPTSPTFSRISRKDARGIRIRRLIFENKSRKARDSCIMQYTSGGSLRFIGHTNNIHLIV